MKIDVLGTPYEIIKKAYEDDNLFEKNNWVGYCGEFTKEIVICDLKTHPSWKEDSEAAIRNSEISTLRHEIVHAFLNESGLSWCSLNYSSGWAKNEEMIDWFAIQGEKIYKAWEFAEKSFYKQEYTILADGEEIAKAVAGVLRNG